MTDQSGSTFYDGPYRELRLTAADRVPGLYDVEQFDAQGRYVMSHHDLNRAQVEYIRYQLVPCRIVMPDGSHA